MPSFTLFQNNFLVPLFTSLIPFLGRNDDFLLVCSLTVDENDLFCYDDIGLTLGICF